MSIGEELSLPITGQVSPETVGIAAEHIIPSVKAVAEILRESLELSRDYVNGDGLPGSALATVRSLQKEKEDAIRNGALANQFIVGLAASGSLDIGNGYLDRRRAIVVSSPADARAIQATTLWLPGYDSDKNPEPYFIIGEKQNPNKSGRTDLLLAATDNGWLSRIYGIHTTSLQTAKEQTDANLCRPLTTQEIEENLYLPSINGLAVRISTPGSVAVDKYSKPTERLQRSLGIGKPLAPIVVNGHGSHVPNYQVHYEITNQEFVGYGVLTRLTRIATLLDRTDALTALIQAAGILPTKESL